MKRNLILGAVALVLLAAAYGAGRYTAPAKVVTKVEVQTVVKEVERIVKVEGPTRVVTRTVIRPAPAQPLPPGCPECPAISETTTESTTSGSTTTTDSTTATASASSSSTTTSREYPRLTLGAGVAYSWRDFKPSPELSVFANYRLAGPLGVWGQASTFGQFSLGLSLTF